MDTIQFNLYLSTYSKSRVVQIVSVNKFMFYLFNIGFKRNNVKKAVLSREFDNILKGLSKSSTLR